MLSFKEWLAVSDNNNKTTGRNSNERFGSEAGHEGWSLDHKGQADRADQKIKPANGSHLAEPQ